MLGLITIFGFFLFFLKIGLFKAIEVCVYEFLNLADA
jgi:hypothetical protein